MFYVVALCILKAKSGLAPFSNLLEILAHKKADVDGLDTGIIVSAGGAIYEEEKTAGENSKVSGESGEYTTTRQEHDDGGRHDVQVSSGSPQQLSIFTAPTVSQEAKKKLKDQLFATTKRVTVGTFYYDFKHILSGRDAAQIASPIMRKSAEHILVIYSDKNNKHLAVYIHIKRKTNRQRGRLLCTPTYNGLYEL